MRGERGIARPRPRALDGLPRTRTRALDGLPRPRTRALDGLPRTRTRALDDRGFTLLEVMIALAILAFLMAAISSAQGSSLLHGARVYNLTTATQLVDGVVMDLEEEYRLDGFPDNSLEGRGCDLPRGFDRFDCEYDLLGLDITTDDFSGQGEAATQMVQSSGLMQMLTGMAGGGADPNMMEDMVGGDPDDPTASRPADLGALQLLAIPEVQALCAINVQQMLPKLQFLPSMIPEIIKKAGAATRKLRIRITWDEAGRAEKTIELETFIVAVPEAEQAEQETRSGR